MSYESDLRLAVNAKSELKSLAYNAESLVIRDTAGETLSSLALVDGMIYQVTYIDSDGTTVIHTLIRGYSYLKSMLNSKVVIEIIVDNSDITSELEDGYIDANDSEQYVGVDVNGDTVQVYVASDLDNEVDDDKYHIAIVGADSVVWYDCIYSDMVVVEDKITSGAYTKDDVKYTFAKL